MVPNRFFRVKSKIIYRPKNVKLTETKEVCNMLLKKKILCFEGEIRERCWLQKNNNNNKPTPLIKS